MNFDEYQRRAIKTDLFGGKPQPVDSHAFLAQLLGLMGEAGEISEKFKKIIRDQDAKLTKENKQEIKKELGDLLWYISVVSTYLGLKLDDVATFNIDKLASRLERGKLRGKGDNR
jgi:NTP pyrophosphatase (non-canonical NTP hydrolase)